MTTVVMRGAELKTLLGGLGLPPSWFAEHMGVTMRTVVRWFDSDTVAPEVAQAIEGIYQMTLAEMRKLSVIAPDADGVIVLRTYRTDKEFEQDGGGALPASWHRALTFRMREHFHGLGYTVMVCYSEDPPLAEAG